MEVHVLGHAGGDGGGAGLGGGLGRARRGGAGQRPAGGPSVLRFIQRHQQLRPEHPDQSRPGLHRQTDDHRHQRPRSGSAGEGGGRHAEEGYATDTFSCDSREY